MNRKKLLEKKLELTQKLLDARMGRMIDTYYASKKDRKAYKVHLDLFRAGADFRERAAFGGNRTGKSHLGSFELSLHLTGQYPEWWQGHRFEKPITAWACGVTLDAVRDINSDKLLGPPTALGTGMIPKDAIVEKRKKAGVPDLYDSVLVRHVSGGTSTLQFKAYAAGREAFQGRKIQFCWLDEECDWPVYEEVLLRTTQTSKHEQPGKILTTLTPLKGLSDVATHFLHEGRMMETDDRFASLIGWSDVPHISNEEKEQLLSSISKHQREARTQGYPSLGSGAIYEYREDSLICEPLKHVPAYYQRFYALDVGWNMTACLFFARDPDSGDVFVLDEYGGGGKTAQEHSANIRTKAMTGFGTAWGAIDPASVGRSQADGVILMDQYQQLGLKLVMANNAVEAGIHAVQCLMSEGRLRVYPHCKRLLSELRMYQRDDKGNPVKKNDHFCDCLRYGVLTNRVHLRPRPEGWKPKHKGARFGWTGGSK
jgi:phage terminase large subunit-like protein